jgi:copper resistance protein B
MRSIQRHRILQSVLAIAALIGAGVSHAAGTGHQAEPDWPLPVRDNALFGQVLFDRFEFQAGDEEDLFVWEAQAWYGGDTNRIWLDTEGEDIVSGGNGGEVEKLDLLYGRHVARFWDLRAGVGYQTSYGTDNDHDRASLVVGMLGLAPYWFEIDTHLRVSEEGDSSAALEAEYDWRLTQRWILQARGETEYAFDPVEEFGIGEGVTGLSLGLRLRYEISRKFAPYIGATWSDRYGDTADLVEAAGHETRESALVAGVRWWF